MVCSDSLKGATTPVCGVIIMHLESIGVPYLLYPHSLADLVLDYKQGYEKWWHKLQKASIGGCWQVRVRRRAGSRRDSAKASRSMNWLLEFYTDTGAAAGSALRPPSVGTPPTSALLFFKALLEVGYNSVSALVHRPPV